MSNPQVPGMNFNLYPETVTLDRFLVGVDAAVSEAVLQDLAAVHRDMPLRMGTVRSEISSVHTHMLFSMRAWLLKGQHVEMKTISFTAPATWWDHLKDDFLKSGVGWKAWLAGRFAPPQYATQSKEYAEMTRVCPHNNTYFPESKTHIDFLLWRDDGDRLE
jgi:hypothetical protein